MISAISKSGAIIADQASSASRTTPLIGLVKKIVTVITLNGILTANIQVAATSMRKLAECAIRCAHNLLNTDIRSYLEYFRPYFECIAVCMIEPDIT